MKNTIRIYNYVDSEKFDLLYEETTSLIRESDYDKEDSFEELLELIKLLLIKNEVNIPKELDGVLYINDKKILRIVNLEKKLLIENLATENFHCFMQWYNKENNIHENDKPEHKEEDRRKESLQSAIEILEVINKPELSYTLHILKTELEHDYIKRIEDL